MIGKHIKPRGGAPLRHMPTLDSAPFDTFKADAPRAFEILSVADGFAAVAIDDKRVAWLPLSAGDLTEPPPVAGPLERQAIDNLAAKGDYEAAIAAGAPYGYVPAKPLDLTGVFPLRALGFEALAASDPHGAAKALDEYRQSDLGKEEIAAFASMMNGRQS